MRYIYCHTACHYDECHYAECRYAVCCGTLMGNLFYGNCTLQFHKHQSHGLLKESQLPKVWFDVN